MNKLKERLLSGKMTIGVNYTLNDPCIIELFKPLDFVWIDTEHSSKDYHGVSLDILAAKACNMFSFVRIPENEPFLAKRILEMGPDAVIFPNVATVEEARRAIDACIYPPEGKRGWGPQRASEYGYQSMKDYLAAANDSFCRFIQIEDKRCVDNLEKILEVPHIDACFIGVHDLSASIGQLGNPMGKETQALVDICIAKCKKANMPLGIGGFGLGIAELQSLVERGIRFVNLACDYNHIIFSVNNALGNVSSVCEKFGLRR